MAQPPSLQTLAGKATAKHLGRVSSGQSEPQFKKKNIKPKCLLKIFDALAIVKSIPPQIQKHIIPFYRGADLADFIDLYEGISNLKKNYCSNEDVFQHFLLDFFLEIENERIHPLSFSRLNRHFFKFRLELGAKQIWFLNDKNQKAYVNVTEFDWATRALGLDDPILPQTLPKKLKQELFFKIKFGVRNGFSRYPIPKIPKMLKVLVRSIPDYSFRDHFFSPLPYDHYQREEYSQPKKEPPTLSEQFFMRLAAMVKCVQRNAVHEGLAFIAEILGREDFASSPFLEKFFVHVWGYFAILLSKIQVDFSLIFSCLTECDKCIFFESDRLDALSYRQQVAAIIGNYKLENELFKMITNRVPRLSSFFNQSFILHLQSTVQFIEDLILEMDVLLKIKEDQEIFEDRNKLVNSIIQKTRRLLHIYFSKEGYSESQYPNIFCFFDVLNVYEIVVQILTKKVTAAYPSVITKLNCISQNLKNTELPMGLFLETYTLGTDLMTSLDFCHEEIKKEAHWDNPLIWATGIYTISILVKFLDKTNNGSLHYATEARLLYEQTNSFRKHLLFDFIYCTSKREKKFQVPTFEFKLIPNFDIFKIFQMEPLIPHLISCGIKSLKRFDSIIVV